MTLFDLQLKPSLKYVANVIKQKIKENLKNVHGTMEAMPSNDLCFPFRGENQFAYQQVEYFQEHRVCTAREKSLIL